MAAEADFYTPAEVALALGLSEATVLSLLTSGQLEGQQDEWDRWHIPASAVASVIEQARQEHGDPEATTVLGEAPAEAAAETTADIRTESGWVTTAQAARALRITPRTVRWHIEHDNLEAKPQGEGVQRTWLVSVDSLQAFRHSRERRSRRALRGTGSDAVTPGSVAETSDEMPQIDYQEAIRLLAERLAETAAEAGELRGRLELTQTAESTLRESLKRERERADRLEEELRAERSKGFWRRLFGG